MTELATKFFRSAGGGDELRIETEVVEIRRASSRWRQRMYRGSELIASQVLSAAITSLQGRPVRFPTEIADALQPHVAAEEA